MKIKIFFLLAGLVLFAGCDAIKDAATVSFTTEIKTDIPVVITGLGVKSPDAFVANAPIAFSETQELNIADNQDIEPYLSKIKEIDINSIVVTVSGLTEGQSINSVSLDVAGIGNVITQTGITMTNNTFTPSVSEAVLDKVTEKLKSERKITVTVAGNVSGPMSFTVGLNMDAKVIAYLIQ